MFPVLHPGSASIILLANGWPHKAGLVESSLIWVAFPSVLVADGKCQQAEVMVLKENYNKQHSPETDSENTTECNGHHQNNSVRTGHTPMDLSEPWKRPLHPLLPKKIQHGALLEVGKQEQEL